MSGGAVLIVEPSEVIAKYLCDHLEEERCPFVVVTDPAHFDSALRARPDVTLVALDARAMARDATGRERPFWHALAARPQAPPPVLCFSGASVAPTDTPLFSPPTGTMTLGSPQDFRVMARLIRMYLDLLTRNKGLAEAWRGASRPALSGTFEEFSFDTILKLIELNAHSGVLLIRDGLQFGLVACERGQAVHAVAGPSGGRDAIFALYGWRSAHFLFLRGMLLGERTIAHGMENLILEASRMDDEASALAAVLPPQSYVRRVKGYTDQLPGKRLSIVEWQMLTLVDRFHIVNDLLTRSNMSGVMAMKALRALMQKGLVEAVAADQPRGLVGDRV